MHSLYPLPEDKYIKDQVIVRDKFDPDEFLENLTQQWKGEKTAPYRNPSPPNQQILYPCTRHPNKALEKRETETQYGHWEYYKCPVPDCFVCSGVDNVEYYLDSSKRQLHHFYFKIPLRKMKCYCEKNPHHEHVPLRNEPREIVLQAPQAPVRHLSMGR